MQRPRPLITLSRPMVQRGSAVLAVVALVGASLVGARLIRGSELSQRIMARAGQDGPEQASDVDADAASTRSGGPDVPSKVAAQSEVGADMAPAIQVTKVRQSADPARVGDEVSFLVEVTNASHLPLVDIRLVDAFDASYLSFLSAEPSPAEVEEAAGRLAWTGLESALPDGSLDPGDAIRIRLRFTAIAPTARGEAAINRAEVLANGGKVADGPAEASVGVIRRLPDVDLCLGDLVYMDLGDDERFDPDAGDLGISGVALSLYRDDDASGGWTDADGLVETLRSEPGGRYRFCGLTPGDYLVMIEPVNFAVDAPLAGLRSSGEGPGGDAATDPDDQVDGDDNGLSLPAGEGVAQAVQPPVVSRALSIDVPAAQARQTEPEDGAVWNTTLDFGFAMREGPGSGAAPLPGSGTEVDLPAPGQEPEPGAGAPPGTSEDLRRLDPGKPLWERPVRERPAPGKPVWGKPVHPRPRR